MGSLEDAQKNVSQSRQFLEQQRQKIKDGKEILQKQRSSLPETMSQESLRVRFSGLKGRQQRVKIEGVKGQIGEKESIIKSYGDKLTKYEQEKVIPVEKAIKKYQEEQAAFETAKKYYDSKIPVNFVENESVKKYLKQWYYQDQASRESFSKQVTQFQKDFPEEKLSIDWKNLRIEGVESQGFGQSLPLSSYNQKVDNLNKEIKSPFESKNLFINSVKEVPKPTKGIYVPELRGYVSNEQTFGSRGQETVISRPATVAEINSIKRSNYRGSLSYFNRLSEKVTTPSGVKSLFDPLGEKTVQLSEKIGQGVERRLKNLGVKTETNLFFNPEKNPIPRSVGKELVSTAYLFGAFEPLTVTGTMSRQTSKYIYDYSKGKFVKKSDILTYLESPKIEISGKKTTIRDLTFNEKSERIKGLLRNLKDPNDQAAVNRILKSAEETYGKNFVKDFKDQEGIFSGSTLPTGVIRPRIIKDEPFTPSTSGVQLKGSSFLETGSTLNPSRVGETNWLGSGVKSDNMIDSDTNSRVKTLSAIDTKSSLKSQQDFKSSQDFKVDQLTDQRTRQDTKVTSVFSSLTSQVTKQPQRFKRLQDQLFRSRRVERPPRKPPEKGKIFRLPSGSGGVLQRLVKKMDEEGIEVFGRRFGKDMSLGVFKTKKGAEKKLESFLKGTLGRSGYLSKDGKKIESSLLKSPVFRPSKKDSKRVVQKSKYSLDSPFEKGEISFFRKKKKKKKNFSWFS